MENSLQVNDQQLMIKEYNNQRVVTMWDIANLHGVDTKNIRKNFASNRKYLLEGEDYFVLEKTSEFAHTLSASKEVSKKAIAASKDIPVFTETGYLMMTKPMTDELSWQVQRILIKSYFKVQELCKSEVALTKSEEPKQLQNLSDINKTIELINSMLPKTRVSNNDRVKIASDLLSQAGVTLPSVKMLESTNKVNYITLNELADRIGIYREDGTASAEGAMACFCIIGANLEDMNLTMRIGDNDSCWFTIKFNPFLVDRISDYLESKSYPSFIEMKEVKGNILRIPVRYR